MGVSREVFQTGVGKFSDLSPYGNKRERDTIVLSATTKGITMFTFTKFTLAQQFMVVSLLILLSGMVVIGLWVGKQIEIGVTNRTAAVTSLYVDSFVSPHLQDLPRTNQLEPEQLVALRQLLSETPLGKRIVSFKVWSPDGRILYSPNPNLIGRQFARDNGLTEALAGEVNSEVSDLDEPENEYERQLWNELIETYAPVWAEDGSKVIAVSEFYQTPDDLEVEIRAAQLRSWLVVSVATLAMYALLAGMVGRASKIIQTQQADLLENVIQLRTLLAQNEQLNERVRRAAARTTALNERFLRRISADLHDGPGQDLALALLRIDSLVESCGRCPVQVSEGLTVADDFRTVQTALKSALDEVRTISAGLRLPEIYSLSTAQTACRAIRDYERKTQHQVELVLDDLPEDAPLSVKITLYRIVQEALANGYRYANGAKQKVQLKTDGENLCLKITDSGDGFDPEAISLDGHLGLAGMRERVEILGGHFDIDSQLGRGTKIRAHLPLNIPEANESV